MKLKKCQILVCISIIVSIACSGSIAYAQDDIFSPTQQASPTGTTDNTEGEAAESQAGDDKTKDDNNKESQFNKEVSRFANEDARLGNELAQLPGPQISFADLMKQIITWSASLAASVALYQFVWASFKAISGTEESHNTLKRIIIQSIIGLTVILFSYQIVAFIMGIIWAGTV